MKDGDREYNGWPNRATWNVNLWVMNDESIYRAWQSRGGYWAASSAKAFAYELWPGGKTPDGDSLADADWGVLAKAWNGA